MADTTAIRNGLCIDFNHGLWTVIEFLHVKPGKGPAFVRTKLKNIETGKVVDNTFPSGAKINPVRIERRPFQFLYKDDMGYNIMHTQTYEQMMLVGDKIDFPQFLKEGMELEVVFHADEELVLYAEMPTHGEYEITYTEPGVKGDTATNTMKPATIDTGAEIRVPLFIDTGDKIKVDIKNAQYSERIK